MTHDDLEQRLWELEYGLLSAEEAAALREQLATDPQAMRLQSGVRGRLSLVARAARVDGPRQTLRSSMDVAPISAESPATTVTNPFRNSTRMKRSANWTMGIASSLLIGLLGWMSWQSRTPDSTYVARSKLQPTSDRLEQQANGQPLPTLIKVEAPAQLTLEAKNSFTILTTTATGSPQSVELRLQVQRNSGENPRPKFLTTDTSGHGEFELAGSEVAKVTKLNVAVTGNPRSELVCELGEAEPQYTTRLRVDKPRYRPGEVVRYRSVTLSRFSLRADRDLPVEYLVTDPNGEEIVAAKHAETTIKGVGCGDLPIAADAAPGRYTLKARNPDGLFPEVKQNFDVRRPIPRQFDIDVKWHAERYAPRARAQGELTVRTPDGQPAAEVKLALRAFVDGRQLELPKGEVITNSDGKGTATVDMPPQIASSAGEFGIQAGNQEVVWHDVPLQANHVQVDFYAEGGDLVAGVEQRVYFHAHDFKGRPVAIRGHVLDADGKRVAAVGTEYEGRGTFRCTPQDRFPHTLKIDDPPNIQTRPTLAPAADHGHLVLDAGAGVVDRSGPLRLRLKSRQPPREFVVAVNCRGVMVGRQSGSVSNFKDGICDLQVPLEEEAAGVLRVTVFDYSQASPEPLAERLVFRPPLKTLNVQLTGLLASYTAGATVRGEVLAKDEAGRPVSAWLGVAAVDEAVLQLADHQPARLPTQFLLLGDVDRAEQLEDADILLSDDDKSLVALDLLLGTQGWRRFDRVSTSRMAGLAGNSAEGLALAEKLASSLADAERVPGDLEDPDIASRFGYLQFSDTTDEAPRRFDNRAEVAAAERNLEEVALGDGEQKLEQVDFTLPQSASPGPGRTPRSPFLAWVAGLLGALVVGGAAVRWRPRTSTVVVTASLFIAIAILGVASSFRRVAAVADPVTTSATTAMTSQVGNSPEPASPEAEMLSDQVAPATDLRAIVPAETAPNEFKLGRSAPAAPLAKDPASALTPPPAPAPEPAPAPPPAPAASGLAVDPMARTVPPPAAKAAVGGVALDAVPAEAPSSPLVWQIEEARHFRLRQALDQAARVGKPAPAASRAVKDRNMKSKTEGQGLEANRGMNIRRLSEPIGAAGGITKESDKSATRFLVRRYAHLNRTAEDVESPGDFTETVYWNPWMLSDEQGRATFEFDLPDTVTKFRISADGHQDGRLGGAEWTVLSEPKK